VSTRAEDVVTTALAPALPVRVIEGTAYFGSDESRWTAHVAAKSVVTPFPSTAAFRRHRGAGRQLGMTPRGLSPPTPSATWLLQLVERPS